MAYLQGFIGILFTFCVAIFVHEFGHFMFAKLFGVRVETFCLGFGRKIWKRKWGETEYAIALIPFGGYVKLSGMHSEEVERMLAGEDEPAPASEESGEAPADAAAPKSHSMSESVMEEIDALREKTWLQKALVFSGGCVNNLLTAVVVFALMMWIGTLHPESPSPLVEEIAYGATEYVPLRNGDRIVALDGRAIQTDDDWRELVVKRLETKQRDSTLTLEVLRGGTTVTVALAARIPPGLLQPGEEIVKLRGKKVAGDMDLLQFVDRHTEENDKVEATTTIDGKVSERVLPMCAALGRAWPLGAIEIKQPPYIYMTLPNLPADKAGIKHGDFVLAINDKPVETRLEATKLIRSLSGQNVVLKVRRGDKIENITVPVRLDPDAKTHGQIGIYWGQPRVKLERQPFLESVRHGFAMTWAITKSYPEMLMKIFRSSFQTIRENVGGPIAIATMSYKAAQQTAADFFSLFATINIILAITNLLPLPVLDGGHILIATIETVTRRPVPPKLLVRIYQVFITLIIGLAVVITFNDILMNLWRVM